MIACVENQAPCNSECAYQSTSRVRRQKTGGMNVYVRELAKAIALHGLAVDVFTRRESPEQPEIDYSLGEGVRVVHLYAGAPIPLDPMDVYPHVQQFAAGVIAFATKQNVIYDFVYANYWLSGWVGHKLKEVWGDSLRPDVSYPWPHEKSHRYHI